MINTTSKRLLAALILILLAANIATLVLLWTRSKKDAPQNDGPPKGAQVFDFVTKELQLDKQQQDTYAKLRDEHQQGTKAIQDSMRIVKEAFYGLLKDPAATDTVIMEHSRKASDIEQQLELFTYRHFQQLRAICRPDQQQKFDQIIQDVLRRMAKPGRRPGPPPGMQGDKLQPPPPGEGDKRPPPGH